MRSVNRENPFARWSHEYWPWYLIYLPVLPGLLYHAFRNRSLVFFTNVDPAIDMGGFFGERKSEIYRLLPVGSYPTTVLIGNGAALADVLGRMKNARLEFPVIVKPDVGERGAGVRRVSSVLELRAVLADQREPLLLQRLVPWANEYGLMFVKDPVTGRTTLLSVAGKRFLSVVGDGASSVEELLTATYRGRRQLERLKGYQQELMAHVAQPGEGVTVEPIGNHCRGTTFIDAMHLRTRSLERVVHALLARTEGIHYGRIDVRAESEEALKAGRFTILELNGVSSEPGHIYDPSYTIFDCWGELLRHVRHIPRISAAMSTRGHSPVTLEALIVRCEAHFNVRLGFWKKLARVFNATRTNRRGQAPGPMPGISM